MSMRLTVDDLTLIAGKITQLNQIDGVEVGSVKVGVHTVFLTKVSDQREGDQYLVVGITDKPQHHHEHPMRGRGNTE